jgi:Bacterial Ig-like domain
MFKRLPYLPLIISLAASLAAAAPAMATDEVPAPPPAQSGAPSTSSPGACTDNSRPTSRISTSASSADRSRSVRGTASDRGCGASGSGSLARVTISVQAKSGKRCRFMSSNGRLGRAKSCSRQTWLTAHGSSRWSFGLPRSLPHGSYTIRVRALDSAGNLSRLKSLRVTV